LKIHERDIYTSSAFGVFSSRMMVTSSTISTISFCIPSHLLGSPLLLVESALIHCNCDEVQKKMHKFESSVFHWVGEHVHIAVSAAEKSISSIFVKLASTPASPEWRFFARSQSETLLEDIPANKHEGISPLINQHS